MKYCMNLKVFELAQNEKPVIYGGQLRPICFEILAKKRDTKNFKNKLRRDKCAARQTKK